jgi:hypothetical protein
VNLSSPGSAGICHFTIKATSASPVHHKHQKAFKISAWLKPESLSQTGFGNTKKHNFFCRIYLKKLLNEFCKLVIICRNIEFLTKEDSALYSSATLKKT